MQHQSHNLQVGGPGGGVETEQTRTDHNQVAWLVEPDQAAEDEVNDEERWIDSDESDIGEESSPPAARILEPITSDGYRVTVDSDIRMASTAAPSARSFSPRPTQRAAARHADSVARTSSIARLRSGRSRDDSAIYLTVVRGP